MFSKSESFKNLMEVYRDSGGDYYVNISYGGAEKIKDPVELRGSLGYNWLEANVLSKSGEKLDEYLFLTCSNDSSVASFPGKITLKKENSEGLQDLIVRIFPTALDDLIYGRKEFLMTRYDRENKLWIYLKD